MSRRRQVHLSPIFGVKKQKCLFSFGLHYRKWCTGITLSITANLFEIGWTAIEFISCWLQTSTMTLSILSYIIIIKYLITHLEIMYHDTRWPALSTYPLACWNDFHMSLDNGILFKYDAWREGKTRQTIAISSCAIISCEQARKRRLIITYLIR